MTMLHGLAASRKQEIKRKGRLLGKKKQDLPFLLISCFPDAAVTSL
jgi:hypothetical protein